MIKNNLILFKNTPEKKYSENWRINYRDGSPVVQFATLLEFLKIAQAREVSVKVFTNPFHRYFWDLLRENDLYEMHGIWLEKLVSQIRDDGFTNVEFWDFSSDQRFSNESPPAAGSGVAPLKWFWEPAHYRRELGDLGPARPGRGERGAAVHAKGVGR